MNLLDFIILVFKKFGDKKTIMNTLHSLKNMPTWLYYSLISSLIVGLIYVGYSKIYSYEVDAIKTELVDIKTKLQSNLYKQDYNEDMYYMYEAMMTLEYMIQYMYSEEQSELDMLYQQMQRNHEHDPILEDIQILRRRNQQNFQYYNTEFKKILYKNNPEIYKRLTDSIPKIDDNKPLF